MKLALSIFAARIILEAARGAVSWLLVELLDFRTRHAAGPSRQPRAAAP